MTDVPARSDLDAYVDEAAKLCGLPIAPAHRPGVVQYLGVVSQAAALVMEFALPEDSEPAPVFRPTPGER
jgi:hypothetical protein